jgi:hypothetical protein
VYILTHPSACMCVLRSGIDALLPRIQSVADLVFWTVRGGDWTTPAFQRHLRGRPLSLFYWVAHVHRFASNCSQTYPMAAAKDELSRALYSLDQEHRSVKTSASAYHRFTTKMRSTLEKWMLFPELQVAIQAQVNVWISRFKARKTFTISLKAAVSEMLYAKPRDPRSQKPMSFPAASARLDMTPQPLPRSLDSMYYSTFTEESWNAEFGADEPPPLI